MAEAEELVRQEWAGLAGMEPSERESVMAERYRILSTIPEQERQPQLIAMANVEYDLPDDMLREVTVSRLRAWLLLERDVGNAIAEAYAAAMTKLSGSKAIRRVSLEQTLARSFSPEEQVLLVEMEPRIFGAVAFAARLAGANFSSAQTPQPEPTKKRWWLFGR